MTPRELDLTTADLDGRNLVEASAGTGKTFALTALYLRFLLEAELPVDRILVVTFTEAATEELRDRIRARLRVAADAFRHGRSDDPVVAALLGRVPGERARGLLDAALECFDEAAILTIHGFCQRVLQEHTFECGAPFDAELVEDERPLLREVSDDFQRMELLGASPTLAAHVQRRKATPEALQKKLLRWVRTPDLLVLPAPAPNHLAAAEARCAAARDALRALWRVHRSEVEALLLDDPGLNRNSYRKTSVPGWLAELDAALAASDLLFPAEHLEKLCPWALEKGTKNGFRAPTHPVFDACQKLEDRRRELTAELDAEVLALQARLVAYARRELARRKAERDTRSFDDLLNAVRNALLGEGGAGLAAALRERYRAALIDEFQDTDPVQYGIFSTVYPDTGCRLYLIGDPKQSIYGFRGADVFAYLAAVSRVDRVWTLGVNRRSAPRLVEAVNALFSGAPAAFVFPEIPFRPVGAEPAGSFAPLAVWSGLDASPLQLWFEPGTGDKPPAKRETEASLTAAVAGEILRLLGAGAARLGDRDLEPGDVAVLVRTNDQAAGVKDALQARGVPAVVYGSGSLFASREAGELLRVLAAVLEPGSDRRVRSALVTDLLGVSGDELAALDDDEPAREARLQRLARYRELWADRGFVVMLRRLFAEERVRERLLPLPDGDRRLTNLLHAAELLQRASLEGKLGPEGLVRWLGRRIEEKAEAAEYEMRLESDEKAVKVVTVHKSKGLEYPVVFCPFLWGGSREKGGAFLYHDPGAPLRLVLDLGSPDAAAHRGLAERESLAENLRLLYVAATRAKNRCYLAWGAYSGADTSPLAHLLDPAPAPAPGQAAPAPEAEVDALAARFAARTPEEVGARLDALAARAGGALRLTPVPPPAPDGARYAPAAEGQGSLECRDFRRPLPRAAAVASFSSLVSGREESIELPDRDEWVSRAAVAPAVQEGDRTLTFFDFPKGSRAGTCLHEMLEDLDYGAGPERREALAREKLVRHGFGATWSPVVAEALGRVLSTPLEPRSGGVALCRVGAADRINELEFYLPSGLLTPKGLAGVFAGLGGPSVTAALPEALQDLGFRPARGFLKGFVDLVFRAEDRFYIVDWKSNHLGSRFDDYGPEGLQRAVDEHLYALQYHLYTAALHRYLWARLPGYDYDRHFGGVFYVFLRGVDPRVPGSGTHRARPSRELVEALSAYLGSGGEP